MRFRDRSVQERLETAGDLAEGVFQKWAARNNIRFEQYGLNRPDFDFFQYLPAELRHTPDFLCEQQGSPPKLPKLRTSRSKFARHFLAEIKGCGRDQLIKIKHAEFEIMKSWERFTNRPVLVFAYDSQNKRVSTSMILSRLEHLTTLDEVDTKAYYDGGPPKPYWAIPTSMLEWEQHLD